MKNLMLTALIAASLIGCTAPSIKVSRADYLTGPAPANAKAETIRKDLTRGENNPGHFMIEAYLYTRPLIESEDTENGKHEMKTDDEISKTIAKHISTLTKNQTCFMFEVSTLIIEAGHFSTYTSKLEDSTGKLHDIKFYNLTGVDSVPSPVGQQGYTWYNSSVGCADVPLDTSKQIKIHFISKLSSDAPHSLLVWEPTK
jgi:hypothetical protein